MAFSRPSYLLILTLSGLEFRVHFEFCVEAEVEFCMDVKSVMLKRHFYFHELDNILSRYVYYFINSKRVNAILMEERFYSGCEEALS